nr:integrase, catalytic region, zinc finger, CCHC-type, peptidase aspartic, catalytic [Tanacetum cinerariifolium]
MFDELLNYPQIVDPQALEVIALIADVIPLVQAESTGSPSLTTVDQDAPSARQFCDSDLEDAFRQHTCFIHNLDGVDLLTGSRGNNLYFVSKRYDGVLTYLSFVQGFKDQVLGLASPFITSKLWCNQSSS